MHPAKIRAALRRRWFERRIEPSRLADRPGNALLGEGYGGWVMPADLIQPSWVCYSVGAGDDVSLDLDLIRRHGLLVRSIDPVPEYVEHAVRAAGDEPRFLAIQAAIAVSDGPVRMQLTHDETSRSVSSAGLYESESYVEYPGRSLASLMSELGDERIDLLKLDVEGAEYQILPTLDLRELGVQVFGIQLHHTGSVGDAKRMIRHVNDQGFSLVAHRPPVKIVFARDELL